MKREELHKKLREEYTHGAECGVSRTKVAGYENIWFVVPPSPPRELPKGLPAAALVKANKVLHDLPAMNEANELDRMCAYLFQRREAVQSSRMEGTWSTIDDVLTPGELYDAKEGNAERASVLGYAEGLAKEIATVQRKGVSSLDVPLVQRLHKAIMSKDPSYRGKAGLIRTPGQERSVVYIGGSGRKEDSIFNPPPPEHVAHCLKSTLDWMADEELRELGNAGMGPSLPVRLAIAHAHFEAVHPFSDGNGRVGRALMTLQIACEEKLPIYVSGYIEKEKKEYIGSLQAAQKQLNYAPIVEFLCEAIVAAHQESEQTKSEVLALPKLWRARAVFRAKSAGERALEWMLTNPIFSAKQIQEGLDVSAPAAQTAVAQLCEKGVVRERTGYGRNRVFAAEEVIALLAREFGAKPESALREARKLLKT